MKRSSCCKQHLLGQENSQETDVSRTVILEQKVETQYPQWCRDQAVR